MKARPAGLSSTSIDSTTPPVMSTGSRRSTSRSSSAPAAAARKLRTTGSRSVGKAASSAGSSSATRRVAELLPALDAAFPTDLLPVVRSFLAAAAGADDDLLVLRRLPVDMTGGVVESMLVDDSPAGRAFITQETITAVTDDSVPRLRPDQRAGRAPRCARRRAGPDRLTPTHWRL